MIFGSVCSGIEAASVAWEPLGWRSAWFSEIEKFPSAVLAHHYPNVPNLGDMTKITKRREFNERRIDLLVGGTPCQSFSIAGLREGMADPRGNLSLVFLGILNKVRPRWVVWENVTGMLSSDGGEAFGSFVGGMAKLGYGLSWRVLDAQYFGVPQRRRRVFVIGYFGDWRPPAGVLFEQESLRRHITQSQIKREDIAGTIAARFGISRNNPEELVVQDKPKNPSHGEGGPELEIKNKDAVAFTQNDAGRDATEGKCPTLRSGGAGGLPQAAVAYDMIVRRLTPCECERLQGFPDNWTRIPWRGKKTKDCPDGLRYRAIGNSMAVPVMRWIGERIEMVDKLLGP